MRISRNCRFRGPSEMEWNQERPSKTMWYQVRPGATDCNQVRPSETKRDQVRPFGTKWDQVNLNPKPKQILLFYRRALSTDGSPHRLSEPGACLRNSPPLARRCVSFVRPFALAPGIAVFPWSTAKNRITVYSVICTCFTNTNGAVMPLIDILTKLYLRYAGM